MTVSLLAVALLHQRHAETISWAPTYITIQNGAGPSGGLLARFLALTKDRAEANSTEALPMEALLRLAAIRLLRASNSCLRRTDIETGIMRCSVPQVVP
mmetsp:Transcript_90482/g.149910  ORF Transcript_90482/g.149910 Transcript_90482/m.149910 type:complete len:99 (+) Transcript_90482:419-715(+)